jgi:hypothetical protein
VFGERIPCRGVQWYKPDAVRCAPSTDGPALEAVPERTSGSAWQRVDGEMVLLQVERRALLGLNAVGGRVWELIDGSRSVGEIIAVIASEVNADGERVAQDVRAFLVALEREDLILVR